MTYSKGHWQNLAQEMRALAADETDPNLKRTLLDIADRYDLLAQHTEKPNDTTENSNRGT